jgi:hypothetical protein
MIDYKWIHDFEGHVGHPYWPGGESGITLDPGFDLAGKTKYQIDTYYKSIVSPVQLAALYDVTNFRGQRAAEGLSRSEVIRSIRVNRLDAEILFTSIAGGYLTRLLKLYPTIETAPDGVQTALLSLAYNRGYACFKPLRDEIYTCNWQAIGEAVGKMQQDHKLKGIRLRRQAESELILSSI